MVKNVKIDDAAHRELSMKAAELEEQKSILCSVLVRAALQHFSNEKLKELTSNYVTIDENS